MNTKTRTALTPIDLCTLIAHETVSLLKPPGWRRMPRPSCPGSTEKRKAPESLLLPGKIHRISLTLTFYSQYRMPPPRWM